MNKFDLAFFKKYVPEWQELKEVIHTHPIKIIISLLVKLGLFVWIPVFLYLYSGAIQVVIPFFVLEIYLLLIYIKIIYDVFDWYNDVWIITDSWVVTLRWSFLRSNSDTINYENIEWISIEQAWIIDKILSKWDVVIQLVGEDSFSLKDAIHPYKATDLIERFRNQNYEPIDKFDIVMGALSGVVWDYLQQWKEEKKENEQKKRNDKEILEKVWQEEGTIDLR
jgi:hypothetical protein